MKHPFVKMIICIIVTIILTIALALNTGAIISMNKEKRLREQAEASINNLSESFNYMVEIDKMVDELYEECVWKNIDLTKIFINTRFVDEEYVGPTVFSDGVVVKYHDGIVEIPEEAENTTPELTAEIMEKALQKGISFDDNNIILSIMTECREEDYHHIQRELNKEMYNLFKNKKVSVKNG